MTVIHHEDCTLDVNHYRTQECHDDRSGNDLGYPGEHTRGCTLGPHALNVPCTQASYTPPASRPPLGIQTSRLDVEIPAEEKPISGRPPRTETAEERAARHKLDKPLIAAFDTLRRAEDGKQRAKIQYGGLSVDVASEDPGLFGRVLAAIGDAITMALGDD